MSPAASSRRPARASAVASSGARHGPDSPSRRGARRADAIDAELGRRLWELRLRRGITRREAAERLGVTAQQVQKYELGQDRLSIGRLVRLAALLEAPLPLLLEGLSASATDESAGAAARRHEENVALLRSFALIEAPELREAVLQLAARLAGSLRAAPGAPAAEMEGLAALPGRLLPVRRAAAE
ncbi:MAG: helix-turn-helix domain-containing protein [Roseococcus sp.]|nr:helix-turn-helix domain-containing protein [Roseococcus sp.]